MAAFDDKHVSTYLWGHDVEVNEGITAAVEFVRKVTFHVTMDEDNGFVFQEIDGDMRMVDGAFVYQESEGDIRITEDIDARKYNMLRDLLAYDIEVAFGN